MKKIFYKYILIVTDLLFLLLIYDIAEIIRCYIGEYFHLAEFYSIGFKNFVFVFVIIMFLFYYEGIYKYRYDFWQESFRILKALFISYLIILSILTLAKINVHYSRLFITIYFGLLMVLFPVYKRLLKYIIFSVLKIFKQNVYIIGDRKQKNLLRKEFRANWYLGIEYDTKKYEAVYITSQDVPINELTKLIQEYSHYNKELFIIPYVTDINFAHSHILEYTNIRLNSIVVENKLLNKLNVFIKTVTDYFFAALTLPVFLAVHVVVFVFIKLDSKGSVFFKQKRLGKDGKEFYIYKYRTMYEDSDRLLEEYLKLHPEEIKYYSKYHKYKNDPRITKVGKILRATSLDELPQFLNVIRGEMSLVGPRPYMLSEVEKLGKYKEMILKVKPGLTGLWQVSGRNELTFKERNELEVWYIKNWSLWLDFVILIKTVKVVFLKIGAR